MTTEHDINLGAPETEEEELVRLNQRLLERRREINPHAAQYLPPPSTAPQLSAFGAPGDLAAPLQSVMRGAVRQYEAAQSNPLVIERRERLKAMERARVVRELHALADDRGVPAHPAIRRVVTAENAPIVEAMEIVEEALRWQQAQRRAGERPPPVTIVLTGPPGCGKTTTLSRHVARWPTPARYVLAREIAVLPENDWGDNKLERRRLASVSLLGIDEAGLEESDRAGARLGALLAERRDGPHVTLIATNLGADEFFGRYVNARLISRLDVEQGRRGCAWWRDLTPVDYRDPETAAALEAGR